MIKASREYSKTKIPGASLLEIRLTAELGESPEEFGERIQKLVNGAHFMEFKRLSAGEYQLLITLNPGWEEPEEFDPSKLSREDLLRDLQSAPAAIHNNKIEHGGE